MDENLKKEIKEKQEKRRIEDLRKEYKELKCEFKFMNKKENVLNINLVELFKEIIGSYNNVLYDQELHENTLKQSNRFYRGHDSPMIYNIEEIPDLYSSKPEIEFPEEDKYITLNDQERKKLKLDIYKKTAIIFARLTNTENRYSYNESYDNKRIYMKDFILYAMKYNKLVRYEDKIAFGFNSDTKGEILMDASLPGYTRLSVHFGSEKKFYKTLLEVNKELIDNCSFTSKEVFPLYFLMQDGKRVIDDKMVMEQYPYKFPRFGVINTGIINRDNYNNAKNYEDVFNKKSRYRNGTLNLKGLKEYINIIGDDLNDREMFYIAEKSGAGKGILENLEQLLQERKKNQNRNKNVKDGFIDFLTNKQFSDIFKCKYYEDYDKVIMINEINKKILQNKGKNQIELNKEEFRKIIQKADGEAKTVIYSILKDKMECRGIEMDLEEIVKSCNEPDIETNELNIEKNERNVANDGVDEEKDIELTKSDIQIIEDNKLPIEVKSFSDRHPILVKIPLFEKIFGKIMTRRDYKNTENTIQKQTKKDKATKYRESLMVDENELYGGNVKEIIEDINGKEKGGEGKEY